MDNDEKNYVTGLNNTIVDLEAKVEWLTFLNEIQACGGFSLAFVIGGGWSLWYHRKMTMTIGSVAKWEWDGLLANGAHHMPAIKEFVKRHV